MSYGLHSKYEKVLYNTKFNSRVLILLHIIFYHIFAFYYMYA